MNRLGRLACIASLTALATTACSSSDKPEGASSTSTTSSPPAGSPEPTKRVIVEGDATLDGKPFNSRWVGAVVLDDGLLTPCQTALPPVADGHYSVSVFAERASAGCGKPGAKVALWIYGKDKILFSTNTLAWPESGSAPFDPTYSSSSPKGATPSAAQFQGGVFDNGRPIKSAKVEAYVGNTRCGVASVRSSHDFTGYVISVVGPDSISGCTSGARIAFRVDGRPATPARNVVNTPPGEDDTLDLRL